MVKSLQQQAVYTSIRSREAVDPDAVSRALQILRARREICLYDRNRLVRYGLRYGGLTQNAIAAELGISQGRVSQIAREEDDLPEGFSGASPTEIVQRYTAGEISSEQVVDELGRWPYAKSHRPDEYDDAWEPGPGTWADVEDAHRHGLISDEMYDEALDRYADNMN